MLRSRSEIFKKIRQSPHKKDDRCRSSKNHRTKSNMAELNIQKHGRSSKIIRQNQTSLQIFKIHRTKSNIARNSMKMHWVRVEFLQSFQVTSDLHQNSTNDDEDGVQNCTFTELSTGIHADEEFYVHHTPNGTRMWCPNVAIVLKPVVGCVYET
ncbi:hypothetical protein HanIR_Chr17g0858061 [Helianthus annuus]|nr:hypothetical protein HanIR_Chr17g0858061 [Helianthus annuus]